MIFETTAVCIEEEQKGMYYGSVEWGFKIDNKSGATLIPLRKLADGIPSDKMIGVMNNWNKGKFNNDTPTSQIPIPKRH